MAVEAIMKKETKMYAYLYSDGCWKLDCWQTRIKNLLTELLIIEKQIYQKRLNALNKKNISCANILAWCNPKTGSATYKYTSPTQTIVSN